MRERKRKFNFVTIGKKLHRIAVKNVSIEIHKDLPKMWPRGARINDENCLKKVLFEDFIKNLARKFEG